MCVYFNRVNVVYNNITLTSNIAITLRAQFNFYFHFELTQKLWFREFYFLFQPQYNEKILNKFPFRSNIHSFTCVRCIAVVVM